MAKGFYHMIFYRLDGYGQLPGYLFVGITMHPAKDKDFLPHGRQRTGERMQIIGGFEYCGGSTLYVFDIRIPRQGHRLLPLRMFTPQIIDMRSGGNLE